MTKHKPPPELDFESEPIKFLARAKKRAAQRFGWNREATLEAGADLAHALLVFRREDEALRVAELFAARAFSGHDKWYCTEHALSVAARLRRVKGDGEAAAAHVARIEHGSENDGHGGFVASRLDGSLMDRDRGHIAAYVADGNVREETDHREFLADELTTVIEVSRARGRDVAALEAEWEQNVARLREIRKVDAQAAAAVKPKPLKRTRRAGVKTLWKRIKKAMAPISEMTLSSLRAGASADELAAAADAMALRLPRDLRDSLGVHDGQHDDVPLFEGYTLLSVERITAEWRVFSTLLDDGAFEGKSADADEGVQAQWWHPGWVPIAGNGGGDFYCVDTAPAKGGKKGQVVLLIHDDASRALVAESFRQWLQDFTMELEQGDYQPAEDGGVERV